MNVSNMWNTFLDTTPRQWGARIRSSIPTWSSPSRALHPLQPHNWGCVGVSVFLHVCAFAALAIAPNTLETLNAGQLPDALMSKVDVAIVETPEVEPVYDQTSGIIVPVKKKQTKAASLADRLLDKYKNINLKKHSAMVDDNGKPRDWRARRVAGLGVSGVTSEDLRRQLLAQAKSDLKNAKDPKDSKDEMTQYLARYQTRFQSCYDSALLKDGSLNGRVRFTLKTGSSGAVAQSQVAFEGVGQAGVRGQLESCLKNITQQIQFPKTMTASFDRSIQFQAVLSL